MNNLILFEDFDSSLYTKGKILTKSNIVKRETSDVNDYPTPLWFINKLKDILRPEIGWEDSQTVDLCCNENNIKFPKGFTLNGSIGIDPPLRENSLKQEWHKYGKFGWLASPYDRSQRKFIEKASIEGNKGMIIIALFQCSSGSKWYKNFVWRNNNCETIQLEGRLNYPQSKTSPSYYVSITIFGIPRGTISKESISEIETLNVHYDMYGNIRKKGLKKQKLDVTNDETTHHIKKAEKSGELLNSLKDIYLELKKEYNGGRVTPEMVSYISDVDVSYVRSLWGDIVTNVFSKFDDFERVKNVANVFSGKKVQQKLKKDNELKNNDTQQKQKEYTDSEILDIINQIIPDTNVTHTRFGKGKVVKTEGEGIHKKADILFPDEIQFYNGTQSNSAHIHLDYVIRNGKLKISE